MPIRPEHRARYPLDWPARSRFIRTYRARGRCEWCGDALIAGQVNGNCVRFCRTCRPAGAPAAL